MLLLIPVTKRIEKSYRYIFFWLQLNSTPIYKTRFFRFQIMFSSRFFSRISSISTHRNFSTTLLKMAPQHRQVAVIGSGPAGNIKRKCKKKDS